MSKIGPMPSGHRYRGLAVPPFFHEESAAAFRTMDMQPSDVVLSSLVKGGTTWCHKLVWSLLHGIDEEGNLVERAAEGGVSVGASGQIYPDALPLQKPVGPPTSDGERFRRNVFGEGCFGDLLAQPAPRLFSTHFAGEFLPQQLLAPDGQGRLIIMLRNLKDVLTSLHFFRGEAKDGWLGNEHGPGSLARFLEPDSPNAYGSCFEWIKQMDQVNQLLQASGRVCVVYFEQLKLNLQSEVERLAAFLGVRLTPAKLAAVLEAVSFGSMKHHGKDVGASAAPGTFSILLRKGEIGDWKNHMGESEWAQCDEAFNERLGAVALAQPLIPFQKEPSQ